MSGAPSSASEALEDLQEKGSAERGGNKCTHSYFHFRHIENYKSMISSASIDNMTFLLLGYYGYGHGGLNGRGIEAT